MQKQNKNDENNAKICLTGEIRDQTCQKKDKEP